jgi:hypothetical protein
VGAGSGRTQNSLAVLLAAQLKLEYVASSAHGPAEVEILIIADERDRSEMNMPQVELSTVQRPSSFRQPTSLRLPVDTKVRS